MKSPFSRVLFRSTMSLNDIKITTHRCSDVAGESCTMLVPIEGYSK
jgi:hypothetical protein